jgi:hypothetical protein
LAEVLLPLDPVFGLPAAMRDGQYPDDRPELYISDVVAESLEIDAAITTDSQARDGRIPSNPVDVTVNLVAKSAAKSRLLRFIVCDGIIEFIRCLR